jgi:Tat protein secretion system quality control protein TatD with DNase activity
MLIDTHCHLTSREFRGKVPDVLRRATEAGVTRAVLVAEDPRDAGRHPRRFVGVARLDRD